MAAALFKLPQEISQFRATVSRQGRDYPVGLDSMPSFASDASASEVLLRQARGGEGEALGALLERLRPWLRVQADALLGSRVAARIDASDIVQQTCLSIHRRLPQFQGTEIGQFLAWVREVHRRNIQDEIRRHVATDERAVGREQSVEDLVAAATAAGDSPARRLALGEDAVFLGQAMEQLPPSQRTAVAMRYLEDYSVAEIAQRMEVSPDAVTSLIRRGLQHLRTRLRRMESE